MTGPHLLAAVAYDEYYNDTARMIRDLGKLLHHNFQRLADAGCKHIQIDEPYFTVADDACVVRAAQLERGDWKLRRQTRALTRTVGPM